MLVPEPAVQVTAPVTLANPTSGGARVAGHQLQYFHLSRRPADVRAVHGYFSAASIARDRECRSAIVIGKCLGGGGVSTFQGIIILALAGLAHVP